ncbi:MAG: HEAT repeat domain-containing protein [Phycisphaerales bacterium]|nr:HEAT repeat domain-containing protein [Phycisphaerales bacterium]
MHDRITSRLRKFVAPLALVACLLAPHALAQSDPMPAPEKLVLTPEEKAQIEAFVHKRVDAMQTGEAADREKARKEIIEPLHRPAVSVAFRQVVRAAAIDKLTELAGDKDARVAINALILLGEIADDATRQVVQEHTGDSNDDVRYAAVYALMRTFRSVNAYAPALDPARVSQAVDHLSGRLAAESNADVADAIVRALLEAAAINRDGYAGPAGEALTKVSSGVVSRLRRIPADDDGARVRLLASCVRVGDALSTRLAAPGATPPEIVRGAAAFAGESLAYLAYHAKKGDLPPPDARAWQLDLTNLAERALVLAHAKLGGSLSPLTLAPLLETGKDSEFFDRTRSAVLGLSGAPCNLSPEAMQRIRDALDGK